MEKLIRDIKEFFNKFPKEEQREIFMEIFETSNDREGERRKKIYEKYPEIMGFVERKKIIERR